ncbi:MAG: nucleotidyltransferase [Candidatus Omnitrophica bacterium 4484_70.1]|nr:MAG: nucleotidyltransferase [Candidatus Omnitrophica bacterium 4484_70.1]
MDREARFKRLKEIKAKLQENYFVKQIGIFGSFVRGEEGGGSDLDILVEFYKPIDMFRFIELERLLSEELNIKVDLVSKKALKPFIGRRILEEVVYV